MAKQRAQGRLAQLWQVPLFAVAMGLFGYAAYLFIDPKPGLTLAQKIDGADADFKAEHFDESLQQCNKLLTSPKIKAEDEARLHLLIAAIIEGAQKEHHISVTSNHERIIEQTHVGLALGGKATFEINKRLGESQEATGNIPEAIAAYREAIAMDPTKALPLQRKVIDLELTREDPALAEASIAEYLKAPGLAKTERAWALGKQAQALTQRGKFVEAKKLLAEVLDLDPSRTSQGVAHYWLGYCLSKLADQKEAERVLRVARDQLTISQPLDADAAYLLGKIRRMDNDPNQAISFYQTVLTTHPESRPATLSRLGRGISRIMLDEIPAGLDDLHHVTKSLTTKKPGETEMAEAISGLKEASALLKGKEDFAGALEALEDEQALVPEPPAEFYSRLASVLEHRADQIEAMIATVGSDADKAMRKEQMRKFRTEAGDAYITLSRALTVADDRGQGEALWKGVDLYDRAGAAQHSIAAMETFVAERPGDGQTPDALLRLGRAYQATGQFDKAIKKFQQNQFRYPQSLAASRSGVPLAQAYIAKGPEAYPKAEKVLLAVLENNQILTPESVEFRQALFELAQLYYRTNRYEAAISRLEEMTQRYPKDPRMGELLFLMADSYRKSAWLLNAKIQPPANSATVAAGTPATTTVPNVVAVATARTEATAARQSRLVTAKALFDRVIDQARLAPPKDDLDRLYVKLSHFYRADCLYDLGEYEEAIHLYDAATLRYQDDPTAVSAYVQIVNAYYALGRLDDARTANERAKWLLRRMPPDSFEAAKQSVPKEYWDNWLRWTTESGMYAKDLKKST